MSDDQPSKRQKKLADARDRNMTRGQLWRARQRRNKGKNISSLRGHRCILVVTNRGRERLGTNEAISILELDESDDDSDDEDSKNDAKETSGRDVQDELARDLEAARSNSKRAVRYEVGLPCLSAIKCDGDPLETVDRLFASVLNDRQARSTHVEKLIPLQATCYPTLESIIETVKTLIRDKFTSPKTFAVIVKVRGHGDESKKLNRMDVIKAVADLVDQTKHPVNLNKPDIIIDVEIIRSIAGVSVLEGEMFRKFKKYNLRSLLDDDDEGDD